VTIFIEDDNYHNAFYSQLFMTSRIVLRNKAIKPLLVAAQRRRRSRGAQNPRPIDRHYETIRMAMQGVFAELGLAA
jgi:hypothetical protein